MSSYRLTVPHPWERVRLGSGMRERAEEIAEKTVARLPDDVPPDQRAQVRIRIVGLLTAQMEQARDNGGVDLYLPTDLMHGVSLGSSFVVSIVLPDTIAPEGTAAQSMAHLLTDSGSSPLTLGGSAWVRRDHVEQRPKDSTVAEDVSARRVDYITPLPWDERQWVIVAYSTVGDGDPRSELSDLMVELFDAIMTTWRWTTDA